jgi:hypothetical protein
MIENKSLQMMLDIAKKLREEATGMVPYYGEDDPVDYAIALTLERVAWIIEEIALKESKDVEV